ncbi:FCD domain-containing protein [Sphingobium sp. YC-XJ3]|uniref:FCD domain-containing protein n=1 Tax=Sphingobium sp. YC-XJ3 TaxID=3024245 RepID=UPI003FD3CC06
MTAANLCNRALVVNPSWVKAHASLHTALVAACGSRRLIALHAQLYEQSERYRGLAAHYETGRDIDHEHQQIVDMALARDADGLVNATLSHMRATTQSIVQAVKAKDAHV